MSGLTKKALAEALKVQIKEKDLAQISVSDLTSLCGIKRQTFYYHFKDIYDLLKWLYKNEVLKDFDDFSNLSWQEYYLCIFSYVKSNKELVIKTYNSIAKDYFQNFIEYKINQFMTKVIDELTSKKNISEENKSYLANYYKNVLIGTLKDWVYDGMVEDPNSVI